MRPPQWALRLYAGYLDAQTRRAVADRRRTQEALLERILAIYRGTEVGRALKLDQVTDAESYRRVVPVTTEDFYQPFNERVLATNAAGIVAPEPLEYLCKTSGTSQVTKYVPYPKPLIAAFKRFETKLAMHYMRETNNFGLLSTQILITAARPIFERTPQGLTIGYPSGVMTLLAPKIAGSIVRPTRPIVEIPDWEAKIEATVREALPLDIRAMTGIPVFVIPILERLLAYAAEQGQPVKTVRELWPNLAVYYWSGSAITLYEPRLRELFGPEVHFREIYSATEAPVAYQHRVDQPGLLVDLENCYFEFQPADSPLEAPRLRLHEVQPGVPYRILLTTLGGLFAYKLGDLVEFLPGELPLLRVFGRETEEINLGFEKVQFPVIRRVLEGACRAHGAAVNNFFVGPLGRPEEAKSAYHWVIEFKGGAPDLAPFAETLDQLLCAENHVYASMRNEGAILDPPVATALPSGTIERYVLETRQFGQGKFPHLYSQPQVPERILAFARDRAAESTP